MKTTEITRIGVIGAGSWGTTLANFLAEKDFQVDLWVREEEVFRQIRDEKINKVFLPGAKLVDQLNPVRTFEEALDGKKLILLVIPSHFLREVLKNLKPYLTSGMSLMAATKGIENDSLMIMSQVVENVIDSDYLADFAYIAGPSFAKEVYQKTPTAVTLACRDLAHGEKLQHLFHGPFFRVYLSNDLIGAQLGGALKNVIAIAAGISDGLNYGTNTRAALITRGLAEITRLGVAMGANPLTFSGMAGMGDLVLTCTGDLSRNRTVGLKIGRGMRIKEITNNMTMVAEGVKTSLSAYLLGKKMGVDMPITSQVYQILYEDKDPKEAVKYLLNRDLRLELEY